ncbi:restriction endonuclease subunit S [Lactobacillus acetotolerans]|uniref:restriction endonuclease subunit S n=3 Tax=Lactobacillus acetotolerans TaxID=1600 RepID=UPI0012E76B48|nr:restriction endonuclease subunit S [Lactobacillus acetotolerans]QGV04651.1 restriction endonuclease subunit S [Lactobacillus acetotolerans]
MWAFYRKFFVWEQRKLGDIAKIVGGGTPSTKNSQYWNGNINWYSPTEIGKNAFVNESKKKITKAGLQHSSAKLLPKNKTILFTSRANIGDLAIMTSDGATNQGFQSWVIDQLKIDIYFLYSLGNILKNQAIKLAYGSTFLEISNKNVKNLQLKIPNIQEQKKIGSLFKIIDELLTLQERKYEELKLLKKALMQNMFADNAFYPNLRFKGFVYKWKQYKLNDLGYTFSGLSGKSKKDFGHGKAQYVTYMNVFSNPIANLEMTEHIEIDNKQNSVKYNDIFFTTSSETPEEVGMSSIWLGKETNTYLNSFCFGFRLTKRIDSYYIAFMLRSPSFRRKMMVLAQGISRFNISKNKVMNIKILLPKISEQKRVGITIKKVDNTVKLQVKFINKIKKFRKFLLQNMFI